MEIFDENLRTANISSFIYIYSLFKDDAEKFCLVIISVFQRSKHNFLSVCAKHYIFLYSLCLFISVLRKKDTTPVFLSYFCRYCFFATVLIVLFLGSSRNFSVGLVSPTTFPFRSQKSIGFSTYVSRTWQVSLPYSAKS